MLKINIVVSTIVGCLALSCGGDDDKKVNGVNAKLSTNSSEKNVPTWAVILEHIRLGEVVVDPPGSADDFWKGADLSPSGIKQSLAQATPLTEEQYNLSSHVALHDVNGIIRPFGAGNTYRWTLKPGGIGVLWAGQHKYQLRWVAPRK